jgi:hypothetical protein
VRGHAIYGLTVGGLVMDLLSCRLSNPGVS